MIFSIVTTTKCSLRNYRRYPSGGCERLPRGKFTTIRGRRIHSAATNWPGSVNTSRYRATSPHKQRLPQEHNHAREAGKSKLEYPVHPMRHTSTTTVGHIAHPSSITNHWNGNRHSRALNCATAGKFHEAQSQ